MVQVRQRILICAGAALALCLPAVVPAQKFFPDDPLLREPPPLPVKTARSRNINEYFDYFQNTFAEPVRKQKDRPDPALAVNTLDEVPDSAWFTNRIGSRPMSLEELLRGPGVSRPPSAEGHWTVLSGKNEGVTPGLQIQDSAGRKYLLKFDPLSNPEMASGADMLGSKLFYALGYNVPENYIVRFRREQLALGDESKVRDATGRSRGMQAYDIDDILRKVPRSSDGTYRALASLFVPGDIIGPFRYYGLRSDDPNDVVPHEERRDLRGLFVFAAWVNHTDSKSINSLDSIVEENGLRFIKHFLIDFGAILGSDSFEAKSPRAGHVYLYDFKPAAWQFLSLGLYVPNWMRADFPHLPSVGHLDFETFEPARWRNNYPNPAFDQRTPADTFWAAKKILAFDDASIRALVETGEYSDPRAVDWIARCLIERRQDIGRTFLDRVLPLDRFALRNGRLVYEDLAVQYGFRATRPYSIQWFEFDNNTGRRSAIAGAVGAERPPSGALYLAAELRTPASAATVTVYVRGGAVVGIDRTW
jgi:hypothetical protein